MAKPLWPTTLLVALVVGIAALACEAELHPSLTELEVGDCVEWPGGSAEVEKLKHVDCSEPDVIRVIALFHVTDSGEWPGKTAIDAEADLQCPWETLYVLGPSKDSWEKAGNRRVACFERVR